MAMILCSSPPFDIKFVEYNHYLCPHVIHGLGLRCPEEGSIYALHALSNPVSCFDVGEHVQVKVFCVCMQHVCPLPLLCCSLCSNFHMVYGDL